MFCNFDVPLSACESCSKYTNEASCHSDGLPTKGANDCVQRCFRTSPTAAPAASPETVAEYVVESYTDLKSLVACPENSKYTAACDFTGKAMVFRCNNRTLDAAHSGRFFFSEKNALSSLKVYDCTLKNGQDVSTSSPAQDGGAIYVEGVQGGASAPRWDGAS